MKPKNLAITLALLVAAPTLLALAGCGSHQGNINMSQELAMRDETIADLQSEMKDRQDALLAAQSQADEAETRATEAEQRAAKAMSQHSDSSVEAEMLPPEAQPGECYARVLTPPVYENAQEQVLVKEASERVEILPARYDWVNEAVLVKEADERIITVPAEYGTQTDKVMVKEASSRLEDVPAEYETITEKVLVSPERTYWKRGHGLVEKVDNNTGEIMCLVTEGPVYKTVTKTVLKNPAGTREITIPAEYTTITRRVITSPATTRTEVIPAVYDTVRVRKMVAGPQEKRIAIPAEYKTVNKRHMVQPSSLEWRRVICETNMTQANVLEIQKALKAKGFNPGPLDGIYGRETNAAVNKFQVSRNLPKGGLTYETVSALGVELSQ